MDGRIICSTLHEEILEGNLTGTIHSVFKNSFNVLDKDHKLITFINSNINMGPNAIQIHGNTSFFNSKFVPNLKLKFYTTFALIEDLNIKIAYDKAQLWNKYPVFKYNKAPKENICKKLDIMSSFLVRNGNIMGIFPLLSSLQGRIKNVEIPANGKIQLEKENKFIEERFLKFMDSYMAEDITNLSNDGKNIIGFGRGLTPSMDDFIAGIMVSHIYVLDYLDLNMDNGLKINEAIIKDIKGRTTLVSEEMLINASQGIVNEDIRQLILSIFGSYPEEIFINNMKRVVNIGGSSGSDIISGIYIGISIGLN